jgi:hypothetical protein
MKYGQYTEVALAAAKTAGAIILEAWDKPRSVMHKGKVDLVRGDVACRRMMPWMPGHTNAACCLSPS